MASEFTIERCCWTSDITPESGSQELHCELPWLLPTPMQKLWLEKEPWMLAADKILRSQLVREAQDRGQISHEQLNSTKWWIASTIVNKASLVKGVRLGNRKADAKRGGQFVGVNSYIFHAQMNILWKADQIWTCKLWRVKKAKISQIAGSPKHVMIRNVEVHWVENN